MFEKSAPFFSTFQPTFQESRVFADFIIDAMKPYATIRPDAVATSEYEDKKSRFFGFVAHVESEEEAIAFRGMVKEQIPEASHYVSAYRINRTGQEHYSDAKEPHGTAGLPVLNVLKSRDLEDVVCVVARIFGGTLLGKGGLMRAYKKAASEAVASAADAGQIATCTPCRLLSITIPYSLYNPLKARLEEWGTVVESEDFGQDVTLNLMVESASVLDYVERIDDLSSGNAVFQTGLEEMRLL